MDVMNDLPLFPRAHSLEIIQGRWQLDQQTLLLSKFPALRNLCLSNTLPRFDEDDMDANVPLAGLCPLLTHYTGSHRLFPYLPASSTLRRATIAECHLEEFLSELRRIPTPISLTSLYTTFTGQIDLATLCKFFPNLTELCVEVHVRNIILGGFDPDEVYHPRVNSFFENLIDASPLPTNIARLAIIWVSEGEDPKELPDLVKLKDTLLERYPALTALWLDGWHYMIAWRKANDRTQYGIVLHKTRDEVEKGREGLGFWGST
ncbi:hypothetical protein B0H10DRAFT_946849 [Mycena sp. CBHHK59/15]|nr:hypothetical protein B0H10DRAFT_946849 [Mycena sp. CBHHK59/15]